MKPKALVLQARGSNRDLDVMEALTLAGADAMGVPLNELRMNKTLLSEFQLLVVPGGFSYADALGAGKLLALDLASYFADEISVFVESGKPVIGICNGFQALVKSGILPGNNVLATKQSLSGTTASEHEEIASGYTCTGVRGQCRPRNEGATLTFNARGHFECRWVTLKPVSQKCVWTKGLDQLIECPVAHGEGNFQTSPFFPLSSFSEYDQIALTYAHPNGFPANGEYPFNPNGSLHDIAGICNPQGNVLGLMPHPENHIHPFQHPLRTRGNSRYCGLALFENGVRSATGI
jgi:phosphoribosylformylglycinamidine synthase subunit PurQ / glutaminase